MKIYIKYKQQLVNPPIFQRFNLQIHIVRLAVVIIINEIYI
jgi:hypothetical protein